MVFKLILLFELKGVRSDMKNILVVFIGVCILAVGLIIYIGESNSYKYEPRYFLGYSKGENYILDTQTGVTLEDSGYSYEVQSDYLYSYGKTGFLKLNLNSGQTYYLFDDQTDEIYKNNILNRCLIEKKEQKPILTYIWTNKNDLTLEEQTIYNCLKEKRMRYPNHSIIVKII